MFGSYDWNSNTYKYTFHDDSDYTLQGDASGLWVIYNNSASEIAIRALYPSQYPFSPRLRWGEVREADDTFVKDLSVSVIEEKVCKFLFNSIKTITFLYPDLAQKRSYKVSPVFSKLVSLFVCLLVS